MSNICPGKHLASAYSVKQKPILHICGWVGVLEHSPTYPLLAFFPVNSHVLEAASQQKVLRTCQAQEIAS